MVDRLVLLSHRDSLRGRPLGALSGSHRGGQVTVVGIGGYDAPHVRMQQEEAARLRPEEVGTDCRATLGALKSVR